MAATDTSEEVRVSAPATPPRENLVRATRGIGLERADGAVMPTLVGHAAVFDRWTEIRSAYEGNFMERIARGAFAKTIGENRDRIRVLFQHGKDPQVGDKPLGPIRALEEDDHGLRYEVELLDTSYNRDLIPGLEAGLYGASFRFSVLRENMVQRPKKSGYNPRGIPERTVEELRMPEFGPVTFGAYADATAGLRSMTDEFLLATLSADRDLSRRVAVSFAGVTVPRFDNEDLGCLAQMLHLATCYIDDQDETDDASDITAMQDVAKTLSTLIQGEIVEVEPPEMDDEGEYSADPEGEERADLHDDQEEPDASERTTRTEPEPSAATTRAISPATGLYTNQKEEPAWLL